MPVENMQSQGTPSSQTLPARQAIAMTSRPEGRLETTEKAPPPPYQASAPNQPSDRQPGPATSGKWYRDDKSRQSITLIYCSDPSQEHYGHQWLARMFVKCSDVPRLMREGFYWNDSNLVREDGFVVPNYKQDLPEPWNYVRWAACRHYFLTDLQQPPRWIARIQVFARTMHMLSHFDLRLLSRSRNVSTTAENQEGHDIYQYTYGKPDKCFNVVYDNTHLKGHWPWPSRVDDSKGAGGVRF
ncbi:hypothetical protein F5X97DRAFT_286016 [Nemania serpens]|nr:hypothetical protein F5X97DRAFT_286016 [Nemania serpens]